MRFERVIPFLAITPAQAVPSAGPHLVVVLSQLLDERQELVGECNGVSWNRPRVVFHASSRLRRQSCLGAFDARLPPGCRKARDLFHQERQRGTPARWRRHSLNLVQELLNDAPRLWDARFEFDVRGNLLSSKPSQKGLPVLVGK